MVKLSTFVYVQTLVTFVVLTAVVHPTNCQGFAIHPSYLNRHPRSLLPLYKSFQRQQNHADTPVNHFQNDSTNILPWTATNFTNETTESVLHISTVSTWKKLTQKTLNSSVKSFTRAINNSTELLNTLLAIDKRKKIDKNLQSSHGRRKRSIHDDEYGDNGIPLSLYNSFNDVDPTFDQNSERKPHVRVKRDHRENFRYDNGYINDLTNSFPSISHASEYSQSIAKMDDKSTNDQLALESSKISGIQKVDKYNKKRSQNLKDNDYILSTLTKYPMDDYLSAKINLNDVYPDIFNPSQDSAKIKLIRKKRHDYIEAYPQYPAMKSQSNEEFKLNDDFPQKKILKRNNLDYSDYYAEKSKLRSDREAFMDSLYSGGNKMMNLKDAREDNDFQINDSYMDSEEQPNLVTFEKQPGPMSERKKRYDDANAYLEPTFMDRPSNEEYGLMNDSPRRRSNVRLFKRSKESANNYLPLKNSKSLQENDLMRMEESEYHPLSRNRKRLVGETMRFRRRIPGKLLAHRAMRSAPMRHGRKKHKKRKTVPAKRTRKNVQEKRTGVDDENNFVRNGEIRLDWPEVVDDMQVESRIEKRDSSDGKSEVDVAIREINNDPLIHSRKRYRRQKKNIINNQPFDEIDASEFEKESNDPREVRHLQKKSENVGKKSLEKRKNNQEKILGANEAKENIQAEVNDIFMKDKNDKEKRGYIQDKLRDTAEKMNKIQEISAENQLASSREAEEKAVLAIEARIKRLVEIHGNANQRTSKNDEKIGETKNEEDSLKSRVKRHENLLSKNVENKMDDLQELKYYENVHEPEDSAFECAPQNENLEIEKFRGDRAVGSVEEIKELADKLVNKVNDLQNYMENVNVERSCGKRRKKKVEVRKTDACYSNMTKILMATTEKPLKLQERCISSVNVKRSSKDRASSLEEKNKVVGENSAILRKAGSVAYAEDRLTKGAETMVGREDRRKRKSKRKWDRWTDWSSCSVTCGKGRQIRWRHCIQDCDTAETEMEEKACQLPACAPGKFLGIFR